MISETDLQCIYVVSHQILYSQTILKNYWQLQRFKSTHSLSVLIVKAQDLKWAVLLKRPVQIPQFPIYPRNHSIVSKTLTERQMQICVSGLSHYDKAWELRIFAEKKHKEHRGNILCCYY